MTAASYGPSPVVPTPMELLALSGSSVTAAAAGKAVGTWAAWRPFGGGRRQSIRCVHGHR